MEVRGKTSRRRMPTMFMGLWVMRVVCDMTVELCNDHTSEEDSVDETLASPCSHTYASQDKVEESCRYVYAMIGWWLENDYICSK
jgi:hypothetical protein